MSSIAEPLEPGAGASPGLVSGCQCEGAVEEFADLAGLAAAVAEAGAREPALEILGLACAALREAVEASGVDLSKAVLPPTGDVVPLFELAQGVGADGLYKIASTAISLSQGDPAARSAAERLAEALGVGRLDSLSDEELAATLLGYLAASARVEEGA